MRLSREKVIHMKANIRGIFLLSRSFASKSSMLPLKLRKRVVFRGYQQAIRHLSKRGPARARRSGVQPKKKHPSIVLRPSLPKGAHPLRTAPAKRALPPLKCPVKETELSLVVISYCKYRLLCAIISIAVAAILELYRKRSIQHRLHRTDGLRLRKRSGTIIGMSGKHVVLQGEGQHEGETK